MSVLSQSFFALVRRHLVSFLFLSVRHSCLFLRLILLSYDCLALDGLAEALSRLECRNVVLRDDDGSVL